MPVDLNCMTCKSSGDLKKNSVLVFLGIVDDLTAAGVRCFGPTARAAQLESSKSFTKSFLDRHGIPTARWKSFTDPKAACSFINR